MSRRVWSPNVVTRRARRAGVTLLLAALVLPVRAGDGLPQPTGGSPAASSPNAQARQWFADAKLGLFIHWGVYSLLGKGEWVMDRDQLAIPSVYGTSRGPIPPQPWGVSTAKGPPGNPREIYLHILNPKDDAPIKFHPSLAWSPHVFGTKTLLKLTGSQRELVLELPKDARLPIDTVVVLVPLHAGRP